MYVCMRTFLLTNNLYFFCPRLSNTRKKMQRTVCAKAKGDSLRAVQVKNSLGCTIWNSNEQFLLVLNKII